MHSQPELPVQIAFAALLALTGIVALLLAFGRMRWWAYTKVWRTQLDTARLPVVAAAFAARDLDQLPVAVQRYLRAVLTEGQKPVTSVDLDHQGERRRRRRFHAMMDIAFLASPHPAVSQVLGGLLAVMAVVAPYCSCLPNLKPVNARDSSPASHGDLNFLARSNL